MAQKWVWRWTIWNIDDGQLEGAHDGHEVGVDVGINEGTIEGKDEDELDGTL